MNKIKLKTLKDIKLIADFQIEGDDFGGLHDVALIDDLKLEAVKRWKHFKKKYIQEKDKKKRIHYWGKMEEIKDFNNITEEDFK